MDFPDDLYRKLKSTAALRGLKVRELVVAYIRQGLNEPARNRSGRIEPPVMIPAGGRVIPARTNRELAELEEEDGGEPRG
jgi:hypothetical protein